MTTSVKDSQNYNPSSCEKITSFDINYFRQRLKDRIHSLILSELSKSGITQKELAKRLGKDAGALSRLLGSTRNMTLDTVSDLLLGIGGLELVSEVRNPFEKSDGEPSSDESNPLQQSQTTTVARYQTTNVVDLFVGDASKPSEFPSSAENSSGAESPCKATG